MSFTIDSPTRFEYVDTRQGFEAIDAVESETAAVTRTVRDASERQATAPEPTGYRITHVFQVAGDEGEPYQYVETMDVETWEHVTPAIDVLMTRTRVEGWTVAITVAQLDLARAG